ncbi:MAG: hypothetical protein ACC707_13625 [Thiohalomonadales bacterium]
MTASPSIFDQPVNRLVLLGASNLTISLRSAIQAMQHRCGQPSDVLVATGHGRSYGQYSQVMLRGLPGISTCGLWTQLESAITLPTYAFLTDIGNDIPYGYLPEQILRWVTGCIEQLKRQSAHIVMTNIQIASLESLSERRYLILRGLFFPFSRLRRAEVIIRAREIHHGIKEMATANNVELFELEPVWFGPDHIHVLFWKHKELYRRIFEKLPHDNNTKEIAGASVQQTAAWRQTTRFASMKILGREYHCQQPSGLLFDGSSVSKF